MYNLFIGAGQFFAELLNISLTASWLALAVIFIRLLMKKTPKWVTCILWSLVGIKLFLPFSIESPLSLIPNKEPLPVANIYNTISSVLDNSYNLNVESGSQIFDAFVGTAIRETSSESVLKSNLSIIACIWLMGVAGMIIYSIISYHRINKKVKESAILKDNIWLSDYIETPFIMGLIKPQIFIPSNINETDIEYVIAHENAHIKRKDHWWKPLGFLLLTIHWFNPILWVAYILMCKDIESACDEKVIKDKGIEMKKAYSNALINCSMPKKMISACPLAFGETAVKSRIKSVLNYKKPALWLIIISLVICVVVGIGFLTNQPYKADEKLDNAISELILFETSRSYFSVEDYAITQGEGHVLFGEERSENSVTVYGYFSHCCFGFIDGVLTNRAGSAGHSAFAATFDITEEGYQNGSLWLPDDGSLNWPSIEEKFPDKYERKVENFRDFETLEKQERAYAKSALGELGIECKILDYSELTHQTLVDDESLDFFKGISGYPDWIGSILRFENGVGFVYSTSYDQEEKAYYLARYADGAEKANAEVYKFNGTEYIYSGEKEIEVETFFGVNENRKVYAFKDSVDWNDPTITLNEKNGTFNFIYSHFSSYMCVGKYELTDDELILKTSDGENVYIFDVKKKGYAFNADKSSKIPEYRYSNTSEKSETSVPDGALFELVE